MTPRLRRAATAIAALLPGPMARAVLRLLGHHIGVGVRIGVSLLLVDHLLLEQGARIGHLNLLRLRRLVMRRGSYFGRGNLVHGPLSIALGESSVIGNRNKIVRGPQGSVTHGPAQLRLGNVSGFTADHRIDCTASVHLGNYSTFAGTNSEIWTHGYVHDVEGAGRYRIDGAVRIGHNVYIGSASIITAGVTIADGVIIGAGTTVARSLLEPGLYVSAGLRQLKRPEDPDHRADLMPVQHEQLCERVYIKRNTG